MEIKIVKQILEWHEDVSKAVIYELANKKVALINVKMCIRDRLKVILYKIRNTVSSEVEANVSYRLIIVIAFIVIIHVHICSFIVEFSL